MESRIELLLNLCGFMELDVYTTEVGTEFVLVKNIYHNYNMDGIIDKTAFEAITNHFHLLTNLTQREVDDLYEPCKKLCKMILTYLCMRFPGKRFFVYMIAMKQDSLILRFHQYWENEYPYHEESRSKVAWCVCCHNSPFNASHE